MFIVHKEALSSKNLNKNELSSAQSKISIGFRNDNTFDHTLYTGADPKSFGGVDVILNQFEC